MSKVWVTSDLHLGHANICNFRLEFTSAEEHHNTVYENLATAVGKRDTVIFLGDVAFTEAWNARIKEIHTQKKILIMGNHDLPIRSLVDVYDDITGFMTRKGFWLSHCPIHESEFYRKKGNIHGHTHFKNILDPRYFNASLENTGYKPILWEEVVERITNQ